MSRLVIFKVYLNNQEKLGNDFSQGDHVQSGAARHSQGFEDEDWGSSPGWRVTTAYCSYLLPKQTRGTPQILIFKTLRMTSRPALYRAF